MAKQTNIQTVLDPGGAIIGQACLSCEIEADEGCEIREDIMAESNAACFKCGAILGD